MARGSSRGSRSPWALAKISLACFAGTLPPESIDLRSPGGCCMEAAPFSTFPAALTASAGHAVPCFALPLLPGTRPGHRTVLSGIYPAVGAGGGSQSPKTGENGRAFVEKSHFPVPPVGRPVSVGCSPDAQTSHDSGEPNQTSELLSWAEISAFEVARNRASYRIPGFLRRFRRFRLRPVDFRRRSCFWPPPGHRDLRAGRYQMSVSAPWAEL